MASETRNDIAVAQTPPPVAGEGARPARVPMFNPLEEMERLFERFVANGWMRPMNWPFWGTLAGHDEITRTPQLDIIDRDKEILVRTELPGVEKKDIRVSASEQTLNIHGTVNREQVERRKDFVRCEITSGNFSRSLPMPAGIDTSAISATLHDGILEIILPKRPGQQRRAVEVK